jgi:hypothetical protein
MAKAQISCATNKSMTLTKILCFGFLNLKGGKIMNPTSNIAITKK